MRDTVAQINSDASSRPPEGMPAKAFLMLVDPDQGQGLAITMFETMDDLHAGAGAPPSRRTRWPST